MSVPVSYPSVSAIYCFSDVVVNSYAHTVQRNGQALILEPKAFSMLVVLLEHAGEVVSKDALLDAVWSKRCVTLNVLCRAATQIRHALDDDARNPRFIETVHTVGYRFIAEVRQQPTALHNFSGYISSIDRTEHAHAELLSEVERLIALIHTQDKSFIMLASHLTALVRALSDEHAHTRLLEVALEHGFDGLSQFEQQEHNAPLIKREVTHSKD